MNETNQTPAHPASRADLAWGRITRSPESGSVIEDRLTALVKQAAHSSGRFRPDVIHIASDEVSS